MRVLERNTRKIHYCKHRIHTNGAVYFDAPLEMDANIVPSNAYWTPSLMGLAEHNKMIFSLEKTDETDVFDIGDRFYVDVTVPEEFDGTADDADYVLEAFGATPNVLTITLTRLVV